jgi:hypothetical protein
LRSLRSPAATDKIFDFNGASSTFQVLADGGEVSKPYGIACVDETRCLVANWLPDTITFLSPDGKSAGSFAEFDEDPNNPTHPAFDPIGIMYIDHLDLVAVASRNWCAVYFFSLAKFYELGRPLKVRRERERRPGLAHTSSPSPKPRSYPISTARLT